MTAEQRPQFPAAKDPHMETATNKALALIKKWQSEGKLAPDTNRLTNQQVATRYGGAIYHGLDVREEPDRRTPGVPLRGEREF